MATKEIGVDMALGPLRGSVEAAWRRAEAARLAQRLIERDGTLWAGDPERLAAIGDRLGWLDVFETMAPHLDRLAALPGELRRAGIDQVVLIGMGGSSLCAEVLARAFGGQPGGLPLEVLDSTHPAAVEALGRRLEGRRCAYLIASKSGGTAEVVALHDLFWSEVGDPGRFLAVTDPGTPLAALATERGYRLFLNPPDIGGRFSALSLFGLIPAALLGLDVADHLEAARPVLDAATVGGPLRDDPSLSLGVALGTAALAGRDKILLTASPALHPLGPWIEQLIAESTGKEGKGLVPVPLSGPPGPNWIGPDVVIVAALLEDEAEAWWEHLGELADRGQPVIVTRCPTPRDLSAEFLRWELATAATGWVLGVNPFDEPNVRESKERTRQLLGQIEEQGRFSAPLPPPIDEMDALIPALDALLEGLEVGDYVALLAFLPPGPAVERALRRMAHAIAEATGRATTTGIGPRYLHSTGQLHKGGPPRGRFLLISDSSTTPVPLPGRPYGLGELVTAQALGDELALRQRHRPVLHVRLGAPLEAAIESMAHLVATHLEGS